MLFGIGAGLVREVIQGYSLTAVPLTPPWVSGVINLRGQVLPVTLIDEWLGLATVPYHPEQPILVVQHGKLLVGFQVNSFHRVVPVPNEEIHSNPIASRNPHMTGIWHPKGQQLVSLLDGESLLNSMLKKVATEFKLFQVRT